MARPGRPLALEARRAAAGCRAAWRGQAGAPPAQIERVDNRGAMTERVTSRGRDDRAEQLPHEARMMRHECAGDAGAGAGRSAWWAGRKERHRQGLACSASRCSSGSSSSSQLRGTAPVAGAGSGSAPGRATRGRVDRRRRSRCGTGSRSLANTRSLTVLAQNEECHVAKHVQRQRRGRSAWRRHGRVAAIMQRCHASSGGGEQLGPADEVSEFAACALGGEATHVCALPLPDPRGRGRYLLRLGAGRRAACRRAVTWASVTGTGRDQASGATAGALATCHCKFAAQRTLPGSNAAGSS